MTNFGVDFEALDKDQKLKQSFHHQRIMESHIAAYAKEVVKALTMQQVPSPDRFAPNGDQLLLPPTPEQLEWLIDRGISIAEMTYRRMHAKGWLAEVPPMAELLEGDGSPAGFGSGALLHKYTKADSY